MRKMIFALMLAAAVILPSTLFAGQGASKLYCSWFNDSSDTTNFPWRFNTWITVSNPNDYDAKFKITYYETDGSVFNNTSTVHTVQKNRNVWFRPNADLSISPATDVKGSYVIDVLEGSLTVQNGIARLAGDTLDDPLYDEDDIVSAHMFPVETSTATFLTTDSFNQYDANSDNLAIEDGESVTWIHINNPSDDRTAKVKMNFFKPDGTKYSLTTYDPGDATTITLTIAPHATKALTPTDYGITGTSSVHDKGWVRLDVTQGSVIASKAQVQCNEEGTDPIINNYRSSATGFNKLVHAP